MRSMVLLTLCACVLLAGCGRAEQEADLSRTLEEGWRAYGTGDFDFALGLFSRVERNSSATDRELLSARLGLATTHHLSTDPDLSRAEEYYSQLEASRADWARRLGLLGRGLVVLDRGSTEEGRQILEELRGEFPDSPEAHEATIHLAEAYFSPTGTADLPGGHVVPGEESVTRGIDVLEYWLTNRPDNPLAATMHMMLADKYTDRSEFRKAVDHLQLALEKGIVSARTRSALTWQVARVAERQLEDYELAESYYQRFVETSRRHVLYYRARQSLERVQRRLAGGGGPQG